jgi:hypothetical protein
VSNGNKSWRPVLMYVVPVIIFSTVFGIPKFM